jgi:hypothetical protein
LTLYVVSFFLIVVQRNQAAFRERATASAFDAGASRYNAASVDFATD